MAMQLSPPQNSGWHTYSGFDSNYFTTVREIRSLVGHEQDSVTIDCQLASSYRCLIQDSNAAVLVLRLKTSTFGRDNVKLRATVKLSFGHDVPQDSHAQVTGGNVARAQTSTLNLTSCQPPALKGLPQGQRQSFQTNIEPTISIGGLFDLGLGSYTRGREQETSTNWLFNTFRKSEDEPSGYYNTVLLQLDAGDRRSLQSFAQRDVTAAAVLENIGRSVTTHSEVELRTSAWLSGLRCWGRNKIRFGRNTADRQFTRRDIMFEQQSTKRIESFEALESLLRSYVTIANEQNLPLEMEDTYSSTPRPPRGASPTDLAPEPSTPDDGAADTIPIVITSGEARAAEQTLVLRQVTVGTETVVPASSSSVGRR